MKNSHDDKVFWFCVYVVTVGLGLLAGLIWIPVHGDNQSMANTAMGFITATVLGVPLAYIFGGNPTHGKKTMDHGAPGVNDPLNEINNESINENK